MAAGHPVPVTTDEEQEVREKLPWHLKLLAVSFVIYMGYRAFQGVEWLIRHA